MLGWFGSPKRDLHEILIRIDKQRRICFVWQGSDAYDVEIVGYH
jgi:plasmid maintenance system killer protein